MTAHADEAPARYESLRFVKVRMHAGPGSQYPVLWVYQRRGLPVEILGNYDVWRKISDPDGTIGWVQETMLSDKRSALITARQRTLRQSPADAAATVALADPGAIARLLGCKDGWCHLKFDDYEGWMKQTEFWGATPGETFGE